MNYTPMLSFLTEDNLKAHVAYVHNMRLGHSVVEKSLPEIAGKGAYEISRMNISRDLKSEIIPRLFDIELHLIYFNSFAERVSPCPEIKRYFSSEDAFCYEILCAARRTDYGFVYVVRNSRGIPEIRSSAGGFHSLVRDGALLALDVSEHAYFRDYGYEREKYLRASLSHINLAKLFVHAEKHLDTGAQK